MAASENAEEAHVKLSARLEEYRFRSGAYASPRGAPHGAFKMPGPCGAELVIVACDGNIPGELSGWEHVSVSCERRIPNWLEMSFVKRMFWAPEECVVQFHPPESEYVNNHPHVLHMWRWTRGEFPMPPSILVGSKKFGIIRNDKEAREIEAEFLAQSRRRT
jgi:hypothetical protein